MSDKIGVEVPEKVDEELSGLEIVEIKEKDEMAELKEAIELVRRDVSFFVKFSNFPSVNHVFDGHFCRPCYLMIFLNGRRWKKLENFISFEIWLVLWSGWCIEF